jgi:thiol-disulfide isomerase/thioredoxin
MSKNIFLFLALIIALSIIPSCISEQEKENNTQIEGGDENNTEISNETDIESTPEEDPFKDYNFTNVIHLGDLNYTSEIQKYEKLYLVFYAPWCGHCHDFIPKFVETADYCKVHDPSVKFAKIDGSKSENASVYFEVNGFPSIYFIYKGEKHSFLGPRTKEGLLYFMKRKMSDDVININKLEELKDIKNMFNTSLILLSTIKNPNEMINKSFRDLAKKAIYMDFVSCLSKECYDKYGDDVILASHKIMMKFH